MHFAAPLIQITNLQFPLRPSVEVEFKQLVPSSILDGASTRLGGLLARSHHHKRSVGSFQKQTLWNLDQFVRLKGFAVRETPKL